jgi:hypothetical protein
VLMYDLKFLPRRQQALIVDLERRMIEALGALVAEVNPAILEVGPTAPKTYALLLFGMLNWTEVWYRTSGPLGPEEMARRIGNLFLSGLEGER